MVAPSATIYVQAARRYEDLARGDVGRVLVVGNPTLDLAGSEEEARAVGALYAADATVLLRNDATKQAFVAAAARHDIVHFAGHGEAVPGAPLRSRLHFARDPERGSLGNLFVDELHSLAFPKTRLVVLSGCDTGSGHLSDTEGVSSLARAFFSGGVPVVVASLWAVGDRSTTPFFVAFHQELLNGVEPGEALRRAQVMQIRAQAGMSRARADWAAFQVIGGY